MKIIKPYPDRIRLAKHLPKRGIGMEYGVWRGCFSVRLLKLARPKIMYVLDCWTPCEPYPGKMALKNTELKATMLRIWPWVLRGIARPVVAFSEEAVKMIPDNHLDWIYLDADHSYKGVSRDLADWYPKAKPGGILSGHDWCDEFEGVERAVRECATKHGIRQIGVTSQPEGGNASWHFQKPHSGSRP